MKNLGIGIVLAAVAIFFWGFLYWGLNPLPSGSWKQTNDDVAAGKALLEHFPESGSKSVRNARALTVRCPVAEEAVRLSDPR